jgi:hypothetical protein
MKCIVSCNVQQYNNTESLRFLGIILRVLRLEVSVYNVYITNQFKATFVRGGGLLRFFDPITSKNSASGCRFYKEPFPISCFRKPNLPLLYSRDI